MEQNTEMAVSPSGAATCGRRRSFPGRPAFLLALAALAVLAVLLTGGVAQAQNPKKPAPPVVKLSSCDDSCITVGFGPFTYEDGSAFSLDSQMFSTTSAITVTDEDSASHTRQGTLHTRLETHWKYTGDPDSNWQEWTRQETPTSTGIRFQSRTKKGLFEVRNLQNGRSYDVRVRVWNITSDYVCGNNACSRPYDADADTYSDWSATATFTTAALPGVKWFRATPGPEGVTLEWDIPDGVEFDGFHLGVNANGVCYCGGLEGLKARGSDTQWVDFIRDGDARSVTVIGFREGQTVQACIRPTMGGLTVQETVRSEYVTIGWPKGTVPGAPGAPRITSLDNGRIDGKVKAPHVEPYVGDFWKFNTTGVDLWPTWTPNTHNFDRGLLDWDKVYLVWDRAPMNGAYITGSQWQYRKKDTNEWSNGGAAPGGRVRWGFQGDGALESGSVYEFRVRSKSSAGWGPWSETAEFLFERKTDLPAKLDSIGVRQPLSWQPHEDWVFTWKHPEWRGAYIHDGIEWREASIKSYHVRITQPGRAGVVHEETMNFSMDRSCRSHEWKQRPHNQLADSDPHNREDYLRIPCSDRRGGFAIWLNHSAVDVSLPLHINIRAMNNSRNKWVDNELIYETVSLPSTPTDVTGDWDATYDNLHLSWTASADDGGAPIDYVVRTDCSGVRESIYYNGGLAHERWWINLGVEETRATIAGPSPGNSFSCDPIEVFARNWYGMSAPVVWNAPPNYEPAPHVVSGIANLGDLTIGESHDISLRGVFEDPEGDPLTITAQSSNTDAATVLVSDDYIVLTVTAVGCPDCRTDITVKASDGKGGEVSIVFAVIPVGPPEAEFDPWVYDEDGNGRISRSEYNVAKMEFNRCSSYAIEYAESKKENPSAPKNIPPEPPDLIECWRTHEGPPVPSTTFAYSNIMEVVKLFNGSHIRVALENTVVNEADATVRATVELYQPAPSPDGVSYSVYMTGNMAGATDSDAKLLDDTVKIAAGGREGEIRIRIYDDQADETVRRRGDQDVHESFTITVISPNGVQLGQSILSIRDNDGAHPVKICRDAENLVVDCNDRPTVVDAPADIVLVNESAVHTVSLGGVFSDDGQLSLTASSTDENVATVALSADHSVLTVTAVNRGTTLVSVTAEDTDREAATTTFIVRVKAAPTIKTQFAHVDDLILGQTRNIVLSVLDADQDDLAVSASSSNRDAVWASVDPSGDAYNLSLYGVREGSSTITVSVEDSDGNRDEATFEVTALTSDQHRRNINQAPVMGSPIADIEFITESGDRVVSLDGMFTDADDDPLVIMVRSSDTSKVRASRNGQTLTVAAVSRGSATVTVTASDGYGGVASQEFTVTVKSAPVLASPIADITSLTVGNSKLIPLAGVFTDADNEGLTIEAVSSYIYAATVTQNSGSLTVTAVAPGTATIGVYATDPDGNRADAVFDVTVVARPQPAQPVQPVQPQKANQAPTFSGYLPDWTFVNESGAENFYIAGSFDDPDGDSLTITAQSSSTSTATASVSSDQSMVTVSARARGKATITVTANDGNGGSVADTFTVTVKAPPVVTSPISDIPSMEEGSNQDVSLSGVFSDPDGDTLVLSASASSNLYAQVSDDEATLTVYGDRQGIGMVTVTATDSDGNEVQDTFAVTVVAAPEPEPEPTPEPEPDPPPQDNSSNPTPFGDVTDLKVGEIRSLSLASIYNELGDGWFYSTVGGFDQDVAWPWVECDSNDHCDPLKVEGVGVGAMSATLHFSNADSTEQRDYTFSVTVIE